MKKIGRQVLLISTSEDNPRNGEGSFIRLKNGAIMFGFTEFIGETREDEENARISYIVSYDEGETWSDRKILFEKPFGSINIMCLSFIRMNNDDIGAFYIVKGISDGMGDKSITERWVREHEKELAQGLQRVMYINPKAE